MFLTVSQEKHNDTQLLSLFKMLKCIQKPFKFLRVKRQKLKQSKANWWRMLDNTKDLVSVWDWTVLDLATSFTLVSAWDLIWNLMLTISHLGI